MTELVGFVDSIVFRKNENGYTVLYLIPDGIVDDDELEEEPEIACTGVFPTISEGENIRMEGEFVTHPSYGRQFQMKRFEVIVPKGTAAIQRYLSMGAIKGIGPALAKRIVKAFKEDTFRIMEEEPERLAEVKGISEKMAMKISDQVVEKKDVRDAMMYLAELGLGTTLSMRIYNEYGPKMYDVIRSNPYRLVEDISHLGFKTADDIASQLGVAMDSEFRIQSGIFYALGNAALNGHTYLPIEELMSESQIVLGVSKDDIQRNINAMIVDGKLIQTEDGVYTQVYYRLEDNTAALLYALDQRFDESPSVIEQTIAEIEREENMDFDEVQREAILQAATRGVFVLTGGPGTGKTTTIKGIIRYFEKNGLEVYLAAPTGRASKRMSEATGREAKTIHRLLEVSGNTEDEDVRKPKRGMFERNEDNPLEADVIIIDEMSMVDISLMHSLLRAVPEGSRLILVGDTNQLPSVGPGNVLSDIISSNVFRTVCLQKIFRQEDTSDIVVSAHQIQEGQIPKIDNNSKDFFLMERHEAGHVITITKKLVAENMPRYVNATPFEVQVLTPMKKGNVGVENLNKELQEYLNPKSKSKKEYIFGDGKLLRVGDKVMQMKNNYQLEWKQVGKYGLTINSGTGVFNGDVGVLKDINEFASFMTVEFEDGRIVEYPFKNQEELELAYAITIHKSQGSEYPAVVIPLMRGPELLMNRNLIYTAITRAQKCVVMVGQPQVFLDMISNTKQSVRYSGLTQRIKEKEKMD
ncbi:MAG: ATP-dependent RecD-like DNA helicase [Lachnospiraceae bacterium]|nr:ATP-dependent RecD-like DNA helicase [Lachnospiraceae bacterium]